MWDPANLLPESEGCLPEADLPGTGHTEDVDLGLTAPIFGWFYRETKKTTTTFMRV